MKTPEQIAAEVAGSYFDTYQDSAEEVGNDEGQPIVETWPALRECIAAAIEADRAQPNYELGVDLPSGQRIMVWVGTSDADGSALVQVDTANAEGNVCIFVNDSDEPIFDENPETGKYEDMAPENEEDDDGAP